MSISNNWVLKIQNPFTGYVLTFYEDGKIFGNDSGLLLIKVNSLAIQIVQLLIDEDISIIKSYGYHIQNSDGFIVKFWDNSRKKRSLKVKGWKYAEEILKLFFKDSNIEKFYISMEQLVIELEQIYATPLD